MGRMLGNSLLYRNVMNARRTNVKSIKNQEIPSRFICKNWKIPGDVRLEVYEWSRLPIVIPRVAYL